MPKIEFVSYNGEYPCLCMGTLVIRVDGVEFKLDDVMISGGSVSFSDDWSEEFVETGDWELKELPEEIEPFHQQIVDLVNSNVQQGCCGGCV